jgi:hypothetical protein
MRRFTLYPKRHMKCISKGISHHNPNPFENPVGDKE